LPIEEAGVAFTFADLWNRTLTLLAVNGQHRGQYACAATMRTGKGRQLVRAAVVDVVGKPSTACSENVD